MKSVRVVLVVVGLLALPLVAAAAQGQSAANKCKNTPQAGQNGNSQRGAAAVAVAQAHKCPAPVPPPPVVGPPPVTDPPPVVEPPPVEPPPVVPPPPSPPLTNNEIHGMVWEDLDTGDGVRDPFAGEMGLAGWSVQLFDANGLLLSSATTDDAGNYVFAALPAGTYSVCVVSQGTYHQTAPLSGTGCGGLGYRFPILESVFGSWTVNIDFGQMLN